MNFYMKNISVISYGIVTRKYGIVLKKKMSWNNWGSGVGAILD